MPLAPEQEEKTAESVGSSAEGTPLALEQEEKAAAEMPVESNQLPGWPEGPAVYAEAGVVMDMDSGAILYSKNMDAKEYPASITKIMTALVALEHGELTDKVTFTEESVAFLEPGDASIGMRPGEEISLEDALYGMLLASANEVAYAIADAIGNGYDNFIEMMNDKAEELGCANTHFTNPHGLHDEEHYVSARDMALIASAAFKNKEFRKITNTYEHRIPPTNLVDEERVFQQYHRMLYDGTSDYYEPCVGGKTGYTDQALSTLVSFLDDGELRLVSVNLKTHGVHVYPDTKNMAEYGFQNFRKVSLKDEKLPEGVQQMEKKAYVVLPEGIKLKDLDAEVTEADRRNGERVGIVTYTYKGQPVGRADAILKASYVQKKAPKENPDVAKRQSAKKQAGKKQSAWDEKAKLVVGIGTAVCAAAVVWAVYVSYRNAQIRKRKRTIAQRRRERERRRRE